MIFLNVLSPCFEDINCEILVTNTLQYSHFTCVIQMLTFVIINSVYAIKGMSGNKEQTEDLGFLSCMYSLEGRKKKGFLSNIA